MTEPDLDLVWGAKAIARVLNTGEDHVYDLRRVPGCPIRQLRAGGKLYASKAALRAWLEAPPLDIGHE